VLVFANENEAFEITEELFGSVGAGDGEPIIAFAIVSPTAADALYTWQEW
jgi:hypothetical protein